MSSLLEEARRLHTAGDHAAALERFVQALYDHGLSAEQQAEMRRLFPPPPPLLQRLEDYETRLNDDDPKLRHKAAKELSRLALGELSNTALHFLRHGETTSLLIRHLDNPDPVVQENMVIALAMCAQRYLPDQRAVEPLLRQLQAKSVNARCWAIRGLACLSEQGVEPILALIDDKNERVRNIALEELSTMLQGGGSTHRAPIGPAGRRHIRDAMLRFDRKRSANDRATAAWLLAQTAEPEDLPALEAWKKKDGSQAVKKFLQEGIDRLQAEPAAPAELPSPPEPKSKPAKQAASKKQPASKKPIKTHKPAKASKAKKSPAASPEPSSVDVQDAVFAPCRFFENSDGGPHSLIFTDFDPYADLFGEAGYDAGGYAWHGVLEALVRLNAPLLKKHLSYDPEASMLVVVSPRREALEQAAALIREACANPDLLRQAIKQANPRLMD